MKRSPLKRRTPLRSRSGLRTLAPIGRRKPINPMSTKRRRLLPKRKVVRETVIERDRTCRGVGLIPDHVCGGPLDVHEVTPGAGRASAWLDPELCVLLCRRAHEWTHEHPDFARHVGLLKRGRDAA